MPEFLFAFIFLFLASACAPKTQQPPSTTPAPATPVLRATPASDTRQLTGELEEGRKLYIRLGCIMCHGGTGEGGTGSVLKGTVRTLKEVQDQLRTPSGMMPSFGPEKLTDGEIKVLYGYIKSLDNIR